MKTEDCIFFQLRKASQSGMKFVTNKASSLNLTPVQVMVINCLYNEDQVTSRSLGKQTRLDSATLTGILDRLEKANIIERRRHPYDRRALQICLTPKGKEDGQKVHALVEKANIEFLEKFNAEEQHTLRRILNALRTQKE